MTFYKFNDDDIIHTKIVAHPSYTVELNGDQVTGSVYLEKQFLETGLSSRRTEGFSAKLGGYVTGSYPLTASVDILDVESGSTNSQLFESILELYDYYNLQDANYTASFTSSEVTRFRVVTIPTIYYDYGVLTGSFSASDQDAAGDSRYIYDDGRGGIYSGSLTGTLVGNIFYNEGFVVLKGGGLNDEGNSNDFGEASPNNFKWQVNFKGIHNIPVKIFRCRAPAGELNASTNPTYYQIPSGTSDANRYQKEVVLTEPTTYITTIGLFDDNYDLVGLAKVSQPIKKTEEQDIQFRIRLDF